MNFYEFASNSPFLTFFLVWILSSAVASIFKSIFGRNKEGKKPMLAKD